jgi:hypothetical protein
MKEIQKAGPKAAEKLSSPLIWNTAIQMRIVPTAMADRECADHPTPVLHDVARPDGTECKQQTAKEPSPE